MNIQTAIERISEAESEAGIGKGDREQQHEVYEKTFRALEDATPDDDDEGVLVMTEWIVERIQTTGNRPGSRAVRRRAAKYCRENGIEVGNNDWLGV